MTAHSGNGHTPTLGERAEVDPTTPPTDAGADTSEPTATPPAAPGTGPISGPDTSEDLRAAARAMSQADPTLTGAALAERFGMSERWGRMQVAAARHGTGTADGKGSDPRNGTAVRRRPDRSGTAVPAQQPADGNRTGMASAASTARQPRAGNGTASNVGVGRRQAAPRAGTRRTPAESVPLPEAVRRLVRVTVGAVAVVTVVAMVHSFVHTRDLALLAGWSAVLAWTLPLAVDGLVVAGSTSLLVDHHLDRSRSPLAWAAVVIGLSSSMAANVVAVDPALIDLRVVRWVMAGYAPVACAISGHLLLRMASGRRPGRDPGD